MGDKATEIPVEGNEELIEAILTLAEIGQIEWTLGTDNLDCSVSVRLSDQTRVSFTYWEFMESIRFSGWINRNDEFYFTWKKYLFKHKGFPKMKELRKILADRRDKKTSGRSDYVNDKLQLFLKEIKK